MLFSEIAKWTTHIWDRYGFDVQMWNDGRFLEDDRLAYVALVPIQYTDYGTSRVADRRDLLEFLTRFWVIWKLPHVNDEIIQATTQETERLGAVRTMTWNTTLIYRRMGFDLPPKDMKFVAFEIEMESKVIKKKDLCQCLITCFDESKKTDFIKALPWFASDEDANAAGWKNGDLYLLTEGNIYGMPKGMIKKIMVVGNICIDPHSLKWFASDTAAQAAGLPIGGFYYLTADNLYGMPKGMIKKNVE